MKKKVVTSVIAVILAAGIGTGVYFGVKSKDKAPQPNAPEVTTLDETTTSADEKTTEAVKANAVDKKTEATTVEPTAGNTGKIQYSNIMTRDEFNKAYPICSNPVKSFSAGKYYAPIAENTGDGVMALRWGTDGRSVMVTTDEENGFYTFYKLNDYGEIIENGYYGVSETDSNKMDYIKRTSKFWYNENHEIIKYGSSKSESSNYTYDKDGNLTSFGDDFVTEKLTYDSNRNLTKYFVSSDDELPGKTFTFRYKTNNIGLPVYVWTTVNGGTEDEGRSIEYTEVSKAQYNFYMSYLKALDCVRATY